MKELRSDIVKKIERLILLWVLFVVVIVSISAQTIDVEYLGTTNNAERETSNDIYNYTFKIYEGWNLLPPIWYGKPRHCEGHLKYAYVWTPEKEYVGGELDKYNKLGTENFTESARAYIEQAFVGAMTEEFFISTSNAWVYSDADCEITGIELEMNSRNTTSASAQANSDSILSKIKLVEGWNIGMIFPDMFLDDYLGDYFGLCQIEEISEWDPINQEWQDFEDLESSDNFSLPLNIETSRPIQEKIRPEDYWKTFAIKVREDCDLSYFEKLTNLKKVDAINNFLSTQQNSSIVFSEISAIDITSGKFDKYIYDTCLKNTLPTKEYFIVSTQIDYSDGSTAIGQGRAFISKDDLRIECGGGLLITYDLEYTPQCKDIHVSGDPEEKIDIIFIPDGYSKTDLTTFHSEIENIKDNFFMWEPFKSNKNKFNLRYVDYPKQLGCVTSSSTGWALDRPSKYCVGWVNAFSALCNSRDIVAVSVASPYLVGAAKIVPFYDEDTEALSFPGLYAHPNQAKIFMHEFGHAFGNFAEEYILSIFGYGHGDAQNCDIAGCPTWCSGEINTAHECYNLYNGYISCLSECNENDQTCIDNCDTTFSGGCYNLTGEFMDAQNFGIDCQYDAGCYPGCGDWSRFRSEKFGIMKSLDSDKFGSINEKLLCELIVEKTGSADGICMSKYGIS